MLIGLSLYLFGSLVDTYEIIAIPIYEKIFLTTRNGLFFGTLFVAFGEFLVVLKVNIKKSIIVLSIGSCMLIIEGILFCEILNKSVVNMALSTILIAPSLVAFALNLPIRGIFKNGKYIRNMSTIMFCCHPMVILVVNLFSKKIYIDAMIKVLIVTIVSIVISFGVCMLSDKIKVLRLLY